MAGNLETVVINRLRIFLANRAEILDAIDNESDHNVGQGHLIERARQVADKLGVQAPEKIKAIPMALARRVEIRPDCVKIDISRSGLAELISASTVDLSKKDRKPTNPSDQVITLMAPVRLKRVGREMKMLVEDSSDNAASDLSLLRIIARAHDIQERLVQSTKLSVHDIARAERVTAADIYTLLRLPWLAPEITTAIVNGRQPPQLNAKRLMRLSAKLPCDWADQRTLLGFR